MIGYSLLTWLRRYPGAHVTGVDIDLTNWNKKKPYFQITYKEAQRLNVVQGDATKPCILDKIEGTFHVILDDGSHILKDMITTFEILFPTKLKKRGIYIVEDVHCDGQMIGFIEYAQSLMPYVYKSKTWDECKMLSGSDIIENKIEEDWKFSIKEIIIHRDIVVFTKE